MSDARTKGCTLATGGTTVRSALVGQRLVRCQPSDVRRHSPLGGVTAVTGLIAKGAGSAALICPTGLANKTAIINNTRFEQKGIRESVRREASSRIVHLLAPRRTQQARRATALPTKQRRRHTLRLVKATTWAAKPATRPGPRAWSFDDATPPSYVDLVPHERWGYTARAVCATSYAHLSPS